MKFVVMVTESRRRGGLLEEKLQHILNSNDVLLSKKPPAPHRSKPSICPRKEPKNVITECTMCNEELTANHVCREYLERLQPHAHYSTVPKGGGDITLTQTQKNFTALGSSIYEDDEQTLFSFSNGQDTGPTIDVATKTEYEESNVDDIQVSLRPEKNHMLQIDQTKNTFPTSWLNTIYSKDTFFYEPVILPQNCQRVNGHYYYPTFFAKEMKNIVDDENSIEQLNHTHLDNHTSYFTSGTPKFVRSVKRVKRDPYCYDLSDKKSAGTKRDKKKLIYPTNYSSSFSSNFTRSQTTTHITRHSPGSDQPKKKRKYVRRTTKEEQIENGTALWQFLMRKLEDSECKSWIRWTGNDLEFKVLDQKEAAKQWGICKNRSKMTFDKFSRSMRFYYSKGILVHNPEKRLTYIFCRQPHDPVYTEMLERVMKTLPPNTIHCTATCLDPSHDHEKIKLNVRRRPKKIGSSLHIPMKGKSSSVEEEDVDLLDAACRNAAVDNEAKYSSLLTDLSYNSNNYSDNQISTVSLIEDGYCNDTTFYGTSSMAALIAAASQAVPVSSTDVASSYTKLEAANPNRGKPKHTPGTRPFQTGEPYLRAESICGYNNDPYSEPMEFSTASYVAPTSTTAPTGGFYSDTPAVVLGGSNRFSEADKKTHVERNGVEAENNYKNSDIKEDLNNTNTVNGTSKKDRNAVCADVRDSGTENKNNSNIVHEHKDQIVNSRTPEKEKDQIVNSRTPEKEKDTNVTIDIKTLKQKLSIQGDKT